MVSSDPSQPDAPLESAAKSEFDEAIDSLRARGAERLDPMGLRFVEALAQRTVSHQGHARQLLEQRLTQSLSDLEQRLQRTEGESREHLSIGIARFPQAAKALRKHAYAGDSRGVRLLLARLEGQGSGSALSELLAGIEPQIAEVKDADQSRSLAGVKQPGELKSMRLFRRTWSKLRAEQQLSDAVSQAPQQAGPLNSHALVLQSLKMMRDISPDYFEQITSHLDTLLWLEQAGIGSASVQKKTVKGKGAAKRSGGRNKPDQ